MMGGSYGIFNWDDSVGFRDSRDFGSSTTNSCCERLA